MIGQLSSNLASDWLGLDQPVSRVLIIMPLVSYLLTRDLKDDCIGGYHSIRKIQQHMLVCSNAFSNHTDSNLTGLLAFYKL